MLSYFIAHNVTHCAILNGGTLTTWTPTNNFHLSKVTIKPVSVTSAAKYFLEGFGWCVFLYHHCLSLETESLPLFHAGCDFPAQAISTKFHLSELVVRHTGVKQVSSRLL